MLHLRSDVAALALAQVGKPYAARGWGPRAFDCVGLCGYCWKEIGVVDYDLATEPEQEIRCYSSAPEPALMRHGLSKYLTRVPKERALIGDALWFRDPKEQHLGIVVSVRGDIFYVVHAQLSKRRVRHQRVRNPSYIICAWRPPGLIDG